MTFSLAMPWNVGEQKMHRLLHLPEQDNPTSSMLTQQAMFMLQRGPLLALGILDDQSRPWTTLWGGLPGFNEPLGGGLVGTRILVDGTNDPVVQALGFEKGKMSQPTVGQLFSALTIDLMTRKRVKIAGRVVAGMLKEIEVENGGTTVIQDELQIVTQVNQSLGNCPKYLNQWEIHPVVTTSMIISSGSSLSERSQAMISNCDTFFLSSCTPDDMDTNHRGGPAGFVRIISPTRIVYPEYSGNRLYQSLGNLQMNPKIGLAFPQFETGDVVYVTGTAGILIGAEAANILPGSNLAVVIEIEDTRHVQQGLAFRGVRKASSPYNPRIRTLREEGKIDYPVQGHTKTAHLSAKTQITASIARFTFNVPAGLCYQPGQWVALSFKDELDAGYEHMRDDDPTSLNDDFTRTFTISSSPEYKTDKEKTFAITVRKVGRITSHLFRQGPSASIELQVLGIGGGLQIHQSMNAEIVPFIAGGIGITPLLGQLAGLDLRPERFRLLWSLAATDIEFVVHVLEEHPKLAHCAQVYITGASKAPGVDQLIESIASRGVCVKTRRLSRHDIVGFEAQDYYICASNALQQEITQWIPHKNALAETFNY